MAEQAESKELKSTGYELFILLLSLVSIVNLAIALISAFVAVDPNTLDAVAIIDTILTVFFLFDFLYRILTTSSKSGYFFRNWGWADLLACVPMLRIFRVFRIFRAVRLLRKFGVKNMVNEIVNNRAGIALYITIFGIVVIAETVGILMVKAESQNPNANITSAADAVWWTLVTMTTVGYGDRFPVTATGRTLAVFVMLSGVALIGVLASFLSNFFLAPPKKKVEEVTPAPSDPKARLAELKAMLDEQEKANAALREKLGEIEKLL